MPHRPGSVHRRRGILAWLLVLASAVPAAGVAGCESTRTAAAPAATVPSRTAPPSADPVPRALPAPAGLPVIDYWSAPRAFPTDSPPRSAVTEGLHPRARRVLYDAPGGKPRAYLPPSISGLPVVVPIVERRPGWVAVLLPSVNRRVGWLTTHGWTARPLRDQLIVRRRAHRLTWLRDGAHRATWAVATGTGATPTPLGRTFVLGRTRTSGAVYGGLDALALGSVPDNRGSLAPSLRAGHTGIHSWYNAGAFGRPVSNGCVRVPRTGQRTLLENIAPGTPVTVID
jgi:lipoprotein-anchoring transpeptidase ErfK/SrfK